MPVDCTTARRFAILCFRGVRRSLAHTRGEPRNRWHRTIRVTRGNLGTQCCVVLFVCYLSTDACRRRPYRVECTGSLPTSEVKRRRARLVLGWGTAWEHLRVLSAFVIICVGLVVPFLLLVLLALLLCVLLLLSLLSCVLFVLCCAGWPGCVLVAVGLVIVCGVVILVVVVCVVRVALCELAWLCPCCFGSCYCSCCCSSRGWC